MGDLVVFDDFEVKESTIDFISKYYSNTDFCPKHWKDAQGKPRIADLIVAYAYGKSLGLNMFLAIKNISIINGQPNVSVEGLLAIINAHKALAKIEQWYEGDIKDGTRTAFCYLKRRPYSKGEEGLEITKSFSIQNAKDAKLYDKAVWKNYTDHMLVTRATGFAIKTLFSDITNGIITREEASDFPTESDDTVVTTHEFSHSKTTSLPRKSKSEVIEAEIVTENSNESKAETNSKNNDDVKLRALGFINEIKEKAQDLINSDSGEPSISLTEKLDELFNQEKVKKTLDYLLKYLPEIGEEFKLFIDETLKHYTPF